MCCSFHQQVSHEDERNIVSSSSSSITPSPGPAPYFNVLQTPTNVYHYDWDVAHPGNISDLLSSYNLLSKTTTVSADCIIVFF